jgi:hypothetical protein
MDAARFRRGSPVGSVGLEDNVLWAGLAWHWGSLPDVHSRF